MTLLTDSNIVLSKDDEKFLRTEERELANKQKSLEGQPRDGMKKNQRMSLRTRIAKSKKTRKAILDRLQGIASNGNSQNSTSMDEADSNLDLQEDWNENGASRSIDELISGARKQLSSQFSDKKELERHLQAIKKAAAKV